MTTNNSEVQKVGDLTAEDFDIISSRGIMISNDARAAQAQIGEKHYIVVQGFDNDEILAVKEKPEDYEAGNLQEIGQEMMEER